VQLEILNRVLAGGRWFSFNASMEAIRAVPELLDGLPVISGEPPKIVVNCRDALTPLLKSPGIGADPLTMSLYRLVSLGMLLSPGSAVVPLLEAWRQMRHRILSMPLQSRRMEASFQSARLGSAVATLPNAPALAKVIATEQDALAMTDLELEEEGDQESRRRSVVVARLAGILHPPQENSWEQLGWPRHPQEAAPVEVGVLAVGLGRLRAEGFSNDQAWDQLKALASEAVAMDLGGYGLLISTQPFLLIKLNIRSILGIIPIGFGVGLVYGGTDGERTRLVGPALDNALESMVRGRPDELCLKEEDVPALARVLAAAGKEEAGWGGRAWRVGAFRVQIELIGSGIYTVRSMEAVEEEPVAPENLSFDFASLLGGESALPMAPKPPEPEIDEGPSVEIEDEEDWPEPPRYTPPQAPRSEPPRYKPSQAPEPSRPELVWSRPSLPTPALDELESLLQQPVKEEEDIMFFDGGLGERSAWSQDARAESRAESKDESEAFYEEDESTAEEAFYEESSEESAPEEAFYEEPTSEEAIPEAPVWEEPASAAFSLEPPKPARKIPPAPDFNYLLAGYGWFLNGDTIVFGRTYGNMMVDYHCFNTIDIEGAHRQFLETKIREGFIPQPDLTGTPPKNTTLNPLNQLFLKEAWNQIA
jgi:hypothetical protein